jgi:hypothetical protein
MGTGLSHGNSSIKETPTSQEKKISEDALRLKIGYGNREAYAVELSMDYTKSDPKRYSFDVSVLKAFDFGIYINPFASSKAISLKKKGNEKFCTKNISPVVSSNLYIWLLVNIYK